MQSSEGSIQVDTTAKFQRNVKKIAKKYRSIRDDVQPLIEQLQAGELPGDRISGIDYKIYKVRIKNSAVQKGKSGGYRLIYYVKTLDKIILLTIYSKSEQEDVLVEDIHRIVTDYEQDDRP